jgi:23S rRNA (guanine2069-N7)-methyltransferase / 23S rRNA (guanine2445-N2)-methyltransferase
MELFVNCPKGFESLLRLELEALGADYVKETVAGVYVSGGVDLSYRICLWSRLANRVLLPIAKFRLEEAEDLYRGVATQDWQQHLSVDNSFAVDFSGRNDHIRHTQFGAQRVKDAIVDQFLSQTGRRPTVDTKRPELRINAYLNRDQVAISLDLSGDSLHRRGYRVSMVPAPLKENLAAAILIRAGWPDVMASGGGLIDPMCGSGTLLIEAAMMAADRAPGLLRNAFGFMNWKQFDATAWGAVRADAQARATAGMARAIPEIRGYDKDARAIAAAETNIAAAGLERWVRVSAKPLAALKKPTHKKIDNGLMVTNPPYGERWGEIEELKPLYQELGALARREFPGWTLAVFTGNPDLAGELRLRADKSYSLFNGTIPAKLSLYALRDGSEGVQSARQPRPLTEQETMLANRLTKNAKRLKSWLKKSGVSCYRLYDQDLPEYAVAIDIYDDAVHVQEYAPPATIDPNKAKQRLREIRRVLLHLFPDCREKLYFKERRKQAGDSQYQALTSWDRKSPGSVVMEGAVKVEINLSDYLDSGLFLDHRPVREMIAGMAKDKRFLNLFCYTAVATLHAAAGGAKSSLSIDMSNTYLEWAERNFSLNNMASDKHRLLRADCLQWLSAREGEFDLIFLDPPTFSNSKKMEGVLDIQRDHVALIDNAMAVLSTQGTLIFSNNFRRFRLDESLADRYKIEDITAQTIPPDFQRNAKIHSCWLIRHQT